MRFLEESIRLWDNTHNLWLIIGGSVAVVLLLILILLKFLASDYVKFKVKQRAVKKDLVSAYKGKLSEESQRDTAFFSSLLSPEELRRELGEEDFTTNIKLTVDSDKDKGNQLTNVDNNDLLAAAPEPKELSDEELLELERSLS